MKDSSSLSAAKGGMPAQPRARARVSNHAHPAGSSRDERRPRVSRRICRLRVTRGSAPPKGERVAARHPRESGAAPLPAPALAAKGP